ncbi:MAG: polyribonucleotide nucleotidyltransferase [Rickettsiales bacterium]
MFKIHKKTIEWGGKTLELETGKIARQATGAVVAKMGGSIVLCTVVAAKKAKTDIDFFPLSVHYIDKFYAAGKIPGGFNKRESRPSEREVLTSRLIDRPIRPLFPENFHNEVQVVCTTLSYDPEVNPDIVALIGASAALAISGIPFETPVAAARVGYADGEFVLNPSVAFTAEHKALDLVVAGTDKAVLMVESTALELSEEIMLKAVMFGHNSFQPIIAAIKELAEEVGNEAWVVELPDHSAIMKEVSALVEDKLKKAYAIVDKQSRYAQVGELKDMVKKALVEEKELNETAVSTCFKDLEKKIVRTQIIKTKKRIDGRGEADIRQIQCELDFLPSVHGSALFTRGETQAIVVTTLGTGQDEQIIDDLEGDRKDRFMLHYNFPSYSVGEVGRMGAPGRREIGHGKLAFRAINPLLPTKEQFPYTIRVVSEITESNGSSSMATVCGTSLSLMAAGVPMPAPVAGIAMGLILEGKNHVVLSDIMGDEDHLGDMDFKVAGTANGITALQMDIKISGITEQIMETALSQAQAGRLHILGRMAEAITESRAKISSNAPQIKSFTIPKDKIGELIGPGGKVIKHIIEQTKVKIDINDEGVVNVASTSDEAMAAALEMINDIVAVPEVGRIYEGKVTRIADFGAFVAITKNTEGLLHVSEMAHSRVNHPRDLFKEGDAVSVKVLNVEPNGKIRLSVKAITDAPEGSSSSEEGQPQSERGQDDSSAGSSHEDRPRPEKRRFNKSGGAGGRRDDRRPAAGNGGNRDNRDNRDRDNRGGGERRRDDGNSNSSSDSSGKKRRFF